MPITLIRNLKFLPICFFILHIQLRTRSSWIYLLKSPLAFPLLLIIFSFCWKGWFKYLLLMFCAPSLVLFNLFSLCCWQNNSGHVSSLPKIVSSSVPSILLPWILLSLLLSWQTWTILLTLWSNRTSFMKLGLPCFIRYTRLFSFFLSSFHPVKVIQLHL